MPNKPQVGIDDQRAYVVQSDGRVLLPNNQVFDPNDPSSVQSALGASIAMSGFNGNDPSVVAYQQWMSDQQSGSVPQASDSAVLGRNDQALVYKDGGIVYNDPLLQARQMQIRGAADTNQGDIDALGRYGDNVGVATFQNNQRIANSIAQQNAWNQQYVDQSQGLTNQLGGYRDAANTSQLGYTNDYVNELNNLSAYNTGVVNNLGGLYDQIKTPLQSQVKWEGDLVSQAAIADPQALAAQNQALGFLGGAMNGSLDYQSQAAGAYADPRYVAMRDQGLADLYDVSQGSKDVHVGQEDPEAYAAAMSALDQMGKLTTPEATDKERFLYEKSRQAQEMDERALSAARMSDLRRRGMAGGGAELTQNALDSQRISQNRLLSDLATNAGAVDRSSLMLQNYGALGSQMNAQANALATGNANRQLDALGAYTQGSEIAQQSSFDQAYKRGVAADTASANNQATRLQGGIAYGNQANTMQQQAFQRGSAADQTAQFNRAQSIDVAKFNTNFAQSERDAQWNRGLGMAQTGLQASSQNANNATNRINAQNQLTTDTYNRNRDVVGMQDTTNTRQNTAHQQQTQGDIYVGGLNQTAINDAYAREANMTGLGMNNRQFRTTGNMSNIDLAMGANAADAASRQAQALASANKSTSLLWGLASW